MLTSLIERNGYSRNRQPILDCIGITAAALSQYCRGRTRPSFHKLVALADFFDVSLDYLVYGEPTTAPEDHGAIARYVQQAFTDVQARSNRHAEQTARIGRLLMERIDDVAHEIVDSRSAGLDGLIDQEEILRVESYCRQADIVATDLGPNIIAIAGDEAVPGQFFHVVAANLKRGCTYRFLLAGTLSMQSEVVTRFRELITRNVGGDRLHEHCTFRRTLYPVMGGVGLYLLDTPTLAMHEPALLNQFGKYVLNGGWLGYLNRANQDSTVDMLMSPDYTERACHTFEVLWQAAGPRG